jgi:hypothetical protein
MSTASNVPFLPSFGHSVSDGEPSNVLPIRLGATILLLVALADWLFFEKRPGASVAFFGAILATSLTLNRQGLVWNASSIAGMILLGGALYQSVVEFNFFNFMVLGLLLSAAMADQGARVYNAQYAVWPLAFVASLGGIGRWQRFFDVMAQLTIPRFLQPIVGGRSRIKVVQILMPAVLIAVPFLLLFAAGNAVLGAHLGTAIDVLERWAKDLHFPSFGRILFWAFVATASLVFLFPRISPKVASLCTKKWPTFAPGADEGVDVWRSLLILIVLNALFFWANGLDAVFLWMSAKLPANVSYSEFVHEGVFSLTTTTILSAVVLAIMFQQGAGVTGKAWVKRLAVLCVAQNLFLISSVGLRLKLYIEAYDLSVLRVHVCTFLVIVATGYGLMAWRIFRQKSLNWMIFSNAAAVLAIFYVVQSVDVNGFVARYNTRCWLENRKKCLDMNYLVRLGPLALPELSRIETQARGTPQAKEAATELDRARAKWEIGETDWRSWQWRAARLRNQVFSTGEGADKHGS